MLESEVADMKRMVVSKESELEIIRQQKDDLAALV